MASQQENPAAQGDGAQIPVFICSLAMPGCKCPLHIFEPRYRNVNDVLNCKCPGNMSINQKFLCSG